VRLDVAYLAVARPSGSSSILPCVALTDRQFPGRPQKGRFEGGVEAARELATIAVPFVRTRRTSRIILAAWDRPLELLDERAHSDVHVDRGGSVRQP